MRLQTCGYDKRLGTFIARFTRLLLTFFTRYLSVLALDEKNANIYLLLTDVTHGLNNAEQSITVIPECLNQVSNYSGSPACPPHMPCYGRRAYRLGMKILFTFV
jgi:hypothetical protein